LGTLEYKRPFLIMFLATAKRLRHIASHASGLDHTDGGVLHLLALFFGDFELREVVGAVFIDVEEDVFADAGA